MSHLVQIKEGRRTVKKARIYEQGSRKHDCMCCGKRKFGVLIRHIAPVKKDTLICDECIILISLGEEIVVDGETKFGPYSKKRIISSARRRPKQKRGAKKKSATTAKSKSAATSTSQAKTTVPEANTNEPENKRSSDPGSSVLSETQ